MGMSVLIGILGGLYLDNKFDTNPVFFWLGFVLGVGAAAKSIVNITKIMKRETSNDRDKNIKKN